MSLSHLKNCIILYIVILECICIYKYVQMVALLKPGNEEILCIYLFIIFLDLLYLFFLLLLLSLLPVPP